MPCFLPSEMWVFVLEQMDKGSKAQMSHGHEFGGKAGLCCYLAVLWEASLLPRPSLVCSWPHVLPAWLAQLCLGRVSRGTRVAESTPTPHTPTAAGTPTCHQPGAMAAQRFIKNSIGNLVAPSYFLTRLSQVLLSSFITKLSSSKHQVILRMLLHGSLWHDGNQLFRV